MLGDRVRHSPVITSPWVRARSRSSRRVSLGVRVVTRRVHGPTPSWCSWRQLWCHSGRDWGPWGPMGRRCGDSRAGCTGQKGLWMAHLTLAMPEHFLFGGSNADISIKKVQLGISKLTVFMLKYSLKNNTYFKIFWMLQFWNTHIHT